MQDKLPQLDDLDLKLIKELESDARVSYATLATKLGSTSPTIYRRLSKLVERNFIVPITVVAYSAFGLGSNFLLAIKAPLGEVDTVRRQLASTKRIAYLWSTSGHYDFAAAVCYKDIEEYVTSFSAEIGDLPRNVTIEPFLSVKAIKNSWGILDQRSVSRKSPIIRKTDLPVISALEKSPLASTKELAEEIGTNVLTVRSSLRRLTSQGIVRVIGALNPSAFPHITRGITLAQIDSSSLNAFTEKLKSRSYVSDISLTFGKFNCVIWTTFDDESQKQQFLTQDLHNTPGVVRYESMSVLKIEKRAGIY